MPAQYVKAFDLFKRKPSTSCRDCGKEAANVPPEQIWTIWNGQFFYCPECARKEGIARDQ
jgi:hypothetical protein